MSDTPTDYRDALAELADSDLPCAWIAEAILNATEEDE